MSSCFQKPGSRRCPLPWDPPVGAESLCLERPPLSHRLMEGDTSLGVTQAGPMEFPLPSREFDTQTIQEEVFLYLQFSQAASLAHGPGPRTSRVLARC